jgi:predicted transposase YbfD/YdcC
MVTYPLDEILLSTVVGVLCGGDDFETIELLSHEYLAWLKQFLPYKHGIPQAQTFRKVFRLLEPGSLEKCFATWLASLQDRVRGVIAIDGKTLRGSKKSANGDGALHLLSAYACEAGLVIGQRAVAGKSNEITAILELLDMLAIKGAIVSIDAMGTQKAIAAKIAAQEADYVLALKGNQTTLHDDVKLFFDDVELSGHCAIHKTTGIGHGRIEERVSRATQAIGWLKELHPEWQNLRSIAAITSTRIDKKTGQASIETRFYITSLTADPAAILAATRAHWSIENNLHWQLDITFDEDRCRSREDFSPLNLASSPGSQRPSRPSLRSGTGRLETPGFLAVVRHAVLNILKRDRAKMSLQRKRVKAAVNSAFRAELLAC